jgi:8-oxo-dGTP pyrophosphatase MutT (NUDIX family)
MRFQAMRHGLEAVLQKLLHAYWRFARPMTLGVRALVIDGSGCILLVKHSYVSGWHLPGGGVEPGETLGQALARELMEEANIEIIGTPQLHGIFFNLRISRRDHVAVYVVREFRAATARPVNHEIIASGFFAADALPGDTTRATRARIREILAGAPKSEAW